MADVSPLRRLLAYGGFTLLSIVVLCWGLRLDRINLGVPLAYHGDVLLILPLVKNTIETGTHWVNPKLGAPGIQELYDYPVVDHLHFAILWVMGQFTPTVVHAYNIYYLAGYPLTVLMSMIVLRSFGVSFFSAGMAGLLFAFLPFHAMRGVGHYFLSAYWTMPLSLWPAIMILHDQRLFFKNGRFTLRSRVGWAAIGCGLITSVAGAYYAFFACAAIAFSGVYTAVAVRSWRPLVCATLATSVIVIGGVAQHLPTVIHAVKHGANPAAAGRPSEDAEKYGLKLPQVVLPVQKHQWKLLSDVRARYDSPYRDLQNENESSTFGIIGSLTFVALMVRAVLPMKRSLPWTPVAALVLFLVLYSLVGGLGAVFNFMVMPMVRSLNRFSIPIAFLCFFALAVAVDRLTRSVHLRNGIAMMIAVVGVWDESPRPWFHKEMTDRAKVETPWRMDAETFSKVESLIPGGAVFCWPYMEYPEAKALNDLDSYQHARGYLHTNSLRWSFGAMKERDVDQWQRRLSGLPVPELLEKLVYRGFDGIVIERRGFESKDKANEFIDAVLAASACPESETVNDELRLFVSLRPFREKLKRELGIPEFERRERAEREAIYMLWLTGFQPGSDHHRWCAPDGKAEIFNPTDRVRRVRVRMVIRSSTASAGELNIDGGEVWSETMMISNTSDLFEREWTIPPGRSVIRFNYSPTKEHVPSEWRNNAFFIGHFTMKESE